MLLVLFLKILHSPLHWLVDRSSFFTGMNFLTFLFDLKVFRFNVFWTGLCRNVKNCYVKWWPLL